MRIMMVHRELQLHCQSSPIGTEFILRRQMLLSDIAFYMGWVTTPRPPPCRSAIPSHHDGWSGDKPKGYTRDPNIDGAFESEFVNLIETSETDVLNYVPNKGGASPIPGKLVCGARSTHATWSKMSIA
jgi:hypothetical protein